MNGLEQKDFSYLLANNWESIKIKVIDKLWDFKFKNMYKSCRLDKDDFDSLADEVLVKAFKKNYNPQESNIYTYATNVLTRKAMTEITASNREKRGGGTVSVSLDKQIDENSDTTLGEVVATKEVSDIHPLAQRYLDSLTKKQRRIAELIIDGYNDKSIKQILSLSDDEYRTIMEAMCDEKKTIPLKKLKGETRWKLSK